MTKIGFEFEFVTTMTATETRSKLKKLGLKFSKKTDWSLVCDMSIESRRSKSMFVYGHELVSPPMAPAKALKIMDLVFEFMRANNIETNTTTGLHVNMDIGKRATKRIEPTKLVTLVDDEAVAKRYNRSKAYYCLPHKSKIRKQVKYWDNLKNKPCNLKDYIKDWGLTPEELDEKYSAINFNHQQDAGYLEFRMIGNRGYENRYKEIAKDIQHFETCMIKAADKDAGNKAVSRRLNKMAA